MATMFNDLSLMTFASDTLRPQSITGATDGVAVDVSSAGTNLINALLSVGAVNTLTSLDVKIQASPTGSGDWVDISGAAFTQVTAANATEIISFQLPTAASATASPYTYVRAQAAITGTSALTHCVILADKRMPNPASGYKNAPPAVN